MHCVKLEREDASERVFYGCRRQRGDTAALPATLCRQGEGWVQERGSWPPERIAALSGLPPGVDRVREDREGIGFYWDEQGSREDVQGFARVLRGFSGPGSEKASSNAFSSRCLSTPMLAGSIGP